MKVKVCGITREEDLRLAARLGAWAVGLVLAPLSPRRLSRSRAERLRAALPKEVLAVGVFQGQPREEILEAADRLRLDAVQIHGAPDGTFPVPVIRAYGVRGRTPPRVDSRLFGVLLEPRRPADRRHAPPPGAASQRGTWQAAASLPRSGPLVILAGGLTPENCRQAAELARPDALDVSSGVEAAPGRKDADKLRRFFTALRRL